MNFAILTISPGASVFERFWRKFKNFVRNRFFFYGGPQSVLDSLIRGLKLLRIGYKLNPKAGDIPQDAIIGVLSNVGALRWAIKAKKIGKIKKIIAGPNLVVLPTDADAIMLDESIDAILLPSEWVKNFWLSLAPQLAPKIKIWAAGVEEPDIATTGRSKMLSGGSESEEAVPYCLVYQKNAPESLLQAVIETLKKESIHFKIINYGRYKKKDYFQLLKRAQFMVFLSKSESQGLALCEAWIRDAPTLVWSRGFMEWKNYRWEAPNISAPYLTDECGMFFEDENDFKEKLPIFLERIKSHRFKAREYATLNFSDKIAAERYWKIAKV